MRLERLGISAITTNNWTLEEDAAAYEAHGIGTMGVWLFKCEGKPANVVLNVARQHGLTISNLCFAGLFTAETPAGRKKAIEDSKAAVDFAAALGCPLLLVAGPSNGHSRAAALSCVRDGLHAVAEYAVATGVMLGLEPLHPCDYTNWSVVNTIDQALGLIEDVDSPNLGIFLDTYNIGWEPDAPAQIARCAGRIVGAHLADWRNPARSFSDRALPGHGVFPVVELVAAIEGAGYRGPYDVEIFSDELWQSDYHALIEEVKRWFVKLEGH